MPRDRHPDNCYEQLSPADRHQLRTCCDGHVHHAAALASEAPAQPNDPYARADRSFPDPGKLPAAGNHGWKFGYRICGNRPELHKLFPIPALRTSALHHALPGLPPRDTPRPRSNPPHLPAPLQTVRTLHRLAWITDYMGNCHATRPVSAFTEGSARGVGEIPGLLFW